MGGGGGLDVAFAAPFLNLFAVVPEQHDGVVLFLHVSQALQVGEKVLGALVDGAAGRRGRFPGFLRVHGVAGDDDVAEGAGFDDESRHAGRVRLLNEEGEIGSKFGCFADGSVHYAFHVEQTLDVRAVFLTREHAETGALQLVFGHDDVPDGFCALEVAKSPHVVEMQMGEDDHVDVGACQAVKAQSLLDGNEAADGIDAVDVFAVFPPAVGAVSGVVENVAEPGMPDQQGADRGAVHSALVASGHNAEILAVEMPEREHVQGGFVHAVLLGW